MKGPAKPTVAVLKGSLDVLVLRALAWQALHGFEVVTWLEERSGGALELEDSAVYQALYRLEARELIESEWGVTENQRRARYYRATPEGQRQLRAETSRWRAYARAVDLILQPATPE